MARGARVFSVDALQRFKAAAAKFAETAGSALAEADADAERASQWLTHEMLPFWQREIRKRQEALQHARSEVYRKELIAMPDGKSAREERKAMDLARRKVEEAELKLEAVRRWGRAMEKEFALFRGASQSMQDAVVREVPRGVARLMKMVEHLEAYAAVAPTPEPTRDIGAASPVLPSMARPDGTIAATAADRYGALRRRVPADAVRAHVTSGGDSAPEFCRLSVLQPDEGVLLRTGQVGSPCEPGSMVVLLEGVLDGRDIFLERRLPASPADSGWSMLPISADERAGMYQRVTSADLVRLCPGLEETLELPVGSLVVVVSGAIEAVLDSEGNDLWNPRQR